MLSSCARCRSLFVLSIISFVLFLSLSSFFFFFFFNDTATTEIYTLSLHDALPICINVDWPSRLNDAGYQWPWSAASPQDRKSTRLNSSHGYISYAVFCLKKKKKKRTPEYH